MLDPRSLRIFLSICRENSISGGARALSLSQPSVSVAMAQLERAVGAMLFERGRRGISLTAAGTALRARAEALELLLQHAKEDVLHARDAVAGPLRVGGTPGALVSLLPEAVKRIEGQVGRLALQVLERPDGDLVGMLQKGEVELALVTTGMEPPPAGIAELTCAREPFDLLVGRANDHLPAEISLRATSEMRWVLPEARGGFRRHIDALFIATEAPTPQDVIRCDSLLTTKAIVRGGSRVTILPRLVAAAELSIGVLRGIRIIDAGINRSVGVRYVADRPLSPLAAMLLAALQP
ncbi:LysR family transcriptional regulator [Sphingomonas sp. BIUV-7]|uniref:LysR family transcriptional regulator n=1 Tax=Sphingomonas natans TaxID=3063330 RepID=A0ABT8Y771_9SPHN|nr:LysR family transcriptional regulator [Sphingomonas sp. BIUV-7]MDO6414154.1 LysR family transcriptional regulator [Sphingomonas sp. BIUV-7]